MIDGATPKATKSHNESNCIPYYLFIIHFNKRRKKYIPNKLVVLVKRATNPSRKSHIAEIIIHQAAMVNFSWLYINRPSIAIIIPTSPKTKEVKVMPFGIKYFLFYIIFLLYRKFMI